MKFKHALQVCAVSFTSLFLATTSFSATEHEPKHFNKIMVIIFENMSYAEIKDEPTFKKLVEYSGHTLDSNGRLIKLMKKVPEQDTSGNGYAFFSRYYNNHSGGKESTRPSQPNYIAMTSGSIQDIKDNEAHDLNVDNLAIELNDADISWKVYAEDLPDPYDTLFYSTENKTDTSLYIKPYLLDTHLSEQENDDAAHKYYQNAYKNLSNRFTLTNTYCFTGEGYPSTDGYQRKHEPFISYLNIQKYYYQCKRIVNSSHLTSDLNNMPAVSFYIPNQINDGHNGTLRQRVKNANAFLSKMIGTNAQTGEPLPNAADAPLQKFMGQGGLLVITFDEPSVTGNPDKTIYTLLAGKMIRSGAYPNRAGENTPICYPGPSEQIDFPQDVNGKYDQYQCNHYNLLKLIETNWNLRGLASKHTSSGYKHAYSLDNGIPSLWKK